jgi:hypothetical protein
MNLYRGSLIFIAKLSRKAFAESNAAAAKTRLGE